MKTYYIVICWNNGDFRRLCVSAESMGLAEQKVKKKYPAADILESKLVDEILIV